MTPDVFNQLELARKYHALGLQLVPLPTGQKAARKSWKHTIERPQTAADIALLFGREKRNTAIFSGPESGNFATIDIDRPDLWSWYNFNIKHFSDIASRTLACKSGGRGGVHLGIKTERPLENAIFRNPKRPDEKGGDIIARNGYALYPRSEVKGGAYEMLFDGFGGIIDLDITDPAIKDFVQCFNLRPYTELEPLPDRTTTGGIIYKNGKPYGLSMKAWGLLTQGDTAGRYQSRSEAEQAVIVECVLKGWGLDTVKELFRRHSFQGAKFREKQGTQGHKYLEINYRNAEKYLQQNKNQIDRDIDRLYSIADSWPWKGQGGRIDRDITRSLLEIARRRRSLEAFGASIRELGELAGVSIGTAFNALRRIPFIINSETNGITCIFTLQAPRQSPCVLNVQVCKSGDKNEIRQKFDKNSMDVFRWQGLGKAGADIYGALLEHGESDIKTLSERARVNIVTVYRKINDLERCGLLTVEKQGRQTILKAIPGADLDKAAEIIGTAGALRRQIERHERERKAYRAYIDRVKH